MDKDLKSKAHVPIYQNFEYQAWKAKIKELEHKGKYTNDSLKLDLVANSTSEEPWKHDTPRRYVSDSSISTPKFIHEIRAYPSSGFNLFPQSKFQNPVSYKPQRSSTQTVNHLQDSFGSYMQNLEEPSQRPSVPIPPGISPYPYNCQ